MELFYSSLLPPSHLAEAVQPYLDLYPHKTIAGCGKCSFTLFNKVPREEVATLFTLAAEWRLKQKLRFFKAHATDEEYCFLIGLAMGLGYKNNSQAFLELYHLLSKRTDLNESELFSYALGICGFFSEKYQAKWKESSYYQELAQIHSTLHKDNDPHLNLRLHQIRPFNHPIRRIAYLTKLLRDPNRHQLQNRLLKAWDELWFQKKWPSLKVTLEAMLPNYGDHFWNYHLSFSSKKSDRQLSLLGQAAAREILINTLLPLLYDTILLRNDAEEKTAFEQFYFSFPAKGTSKSDYLKHRFFGDSLKGELMHSALIEQGAYQLHQDFCLRYETSCEGCPFVENYQIKESDAPATAITNT